MDMPLNSPAGNADKKATREAWDWVFQTEGFFDAFDADDDNDDKGDRGGGIAPVPPTAPFVKKESRLRFASRFAYKSSRTAEERFTFSDS